jgi:hypothetical protein
MPSIPVAVAETTLFQRTAGKILSAAEIDDLIDFLARNPLAGDVIEGTGGLRKMRWRLSGRGKRGGARVIYYFHDGDMPLFLLLAYAKAAAENITAAEKRRMAAVATEIIDAYRMTRSRQ